MRDGAIPCVGFDERLPAASGELIVAAARPVRLARPVIVFPRRRHVAQGLETAERGVDGAGRQAGRGHDVEAESMALGQGLQREEGDVGEGHVCVST